MPSKRAWCLLALLLGACAIPNISIVESLDETRGGSSGKSGAATQAGTKNAQGGSSGEPDLPAGSDSGPGGVDNTGGTEPSTGGNPPSGGNPPTAGGGSGPPPGKTAVGKFCNAIVVAGESVSLDFRIGEGANLVHIVADSGTCSPAVNRPCLPIQTGSDVPVGVYDLDGNELYRASTRIEPGDAWIFMLYFDEDDQDARIAGEPDITASECSSLDFDSLLGPSPAP